MNWKSVSSDPNSRASREYRSEKLSAARRGCVRDRAERLVELVRGKKVLDIGCVAHDARFEAGDDWLHRHIVNNAESCLGVDILDSEVNILRSKGYNVICRDVFQDPLDELFDIIVCGEVIEHLPAPQSLFSSASSMLENNGKLVLSTPNANYVGLMPSRLKGIFDSVDHVMIFDPSHICELSEREGFELTSFYGLDAFSRVSVVKKLPLMIAAGLFGWVDEYRCKSIIYELTKKS